MNNLWEGYRGPSAIHPHEREAMDKNAPELLAACRLAKAAIATAVEFVNDDAPNTPHAAISALHLILYRAIAKAESDDFEGK